jgi:predicted lipid-binding transport protein (Tim44 family)
MKRVALGLFIALLGVSFVAADADARRLGGGATSGLKRQMPPPAQPAQTPPAQKQAATPAPANTAAPAAPAPRRSWLGPIAGIAAGLGLAALMSHFGLGAEFGSLLTMLLIGIVAVFAIRFLMRRFAGAASRPAMAGAGAGNAWASDATARAPFEPTALGTPAAAAVGSGVGSAAAASAVPAGFDSAAFERAAKLIFIRMQAANDAGDLADLRRFSTPEMYATFRLDLQDRRDTAQRTDVVRLDAQVLDVAEEAGRQIVSVRFHGLIREEQDAPTHDFDEIWHLAKPADGSSDWVIAGIAQSEAA